METIERIDPVAEARERVEKAIERLPSYWREMFLDEFQQYNTKEGRRLLTHVGRGSSTDLRITRLLENLADDYENMKVHGSKTKLKETA